MDLIKIITSKTNLPKWLWGEALRTALYIINRVFKKSVSKPIFKYSWETFPEKGVKG